MEMRGLEPLLWTFPVWRKSAGRFTLLTASGAVRHQPNNCLNRKPA